MTGRSCRTSVKSSLAGVVRQRTTSRVLDHLAGRCLSGKSSNEEGDVLRTPRMPGMEVQWRLLFAA